MSNTAITQTPLITASRISHSVFKLELFYSLFAMKRKIQIKYTFNTLLKEHNHVFAHAQDFDFWTGNREFVYARINIELLQIPLHRSQSSLALP